MEVRPDQKHKDQSVLAVPLAQRLALTLREACALTGLKQYQLRAAIHGGELAFIQNGTRGQFIIRREALDRFLRATERCELQ
jgi:excisionase family DNA binding protein